MEHQFTIRQRFWRDAGPREIVHVGYLLVHIYAEYHTDTRIIDMRVVTGDIVAINGNSETELRAQIGPMQTTTFQSLRSIGDPIRDVRTSSGDNLFDHLLDYFAGVSHSLDTFQENSLYNWLLDICLHFHGNEVGAIGEFNVHRERDSTNHWQR